MHVAIEQFRRDIQRVRGLGSLYRVLSLQTTQALDLSDLLRSELVMVVSALDHFVHELVRLGMLEVSRSERAQTEAYLRFQVTLGSALDGVDNPGNASWLEDQIRSRNGYRAFQDPDNIADAIRLISGVELWNAVADEMDSTARDIRALLRLIVDRRNKIAHESDIDPSYAHIGTLWPIDATMADESVAFVEPLAEAIFTVVA